MLHSNLLVLINKQMFLALKLNRTARTSLTSNMCRCRCSFKLTRRSIARFDRVDNAQISQISRTDRQTHRQSDFLGFLSKPKESMSNSLSDFKTTLMFHRHVPVIRIRPRQSFVWILIHTFITRSIISEYFTAEILITVAAGGETKSPAQY